MITRIAILVWLIIISGSFASRVCLAQESLIDIRVDENPGRDQFGQNKKHFIETRFFYGIYFADHMKMKHHIKYGSYDAEVYLRYKRKLTPVLSTGLSLSLIQKQYNFKLPENPHLEMPEKDRIRITGIKTGTFIRINLDPERGDFMEAIPMVLKEFWSLILMMKVRVIENQRRLDRD